MDLSDGAEPFAPYDGEDHFETVAEGGTCEHTFETAGQYTDVCVPHVEQGMIARVVVES